MGSRKLWAGGLGLLLVALVAAFGVRMFNAPRPEAPTDMLPWQVDVLPEGRSRVFGLTLGDSRLEDARASLGPDLELAVLTSGTGAASLEAYYERVQLGFVTGRLILTAELPAEQLSAMAQRAKKTAPLPSGARKATPAAEDMPSAWNAPIVGISFVPSINLDESTVLARFGSPAQRVASPGGVEHFLYPAIGLDLVLSAEGKELLQYVAPRDFARLREPLLTAGAR